MKKAAIFSALMLGSALALSASAQAEPLHRHWHVRPAAHPHFVLRHDFRHFTAAERHWWGGGRWRHTWWHGRYGWWWNIGPAWYFYDAPVYPYPGYVSNEYYDDQDYDDGDQGGYDDQGGPGNYQGGPGDQGGYDQGGGYGTWYHCSNPEGYYPYVKNCRNWEQVPAQPNNMGPGPGGGPNDAPPGYNGDNQGPPPPGR